MLSLVSLCLTMYEIQLPQGTFAVKCTPVSEDFNYSLHYFKITRSRVCVRSIVCTLSIKTTWVFERQSLTDCKYSSKFLHSPHITLCRIFWVNSYRSLWQPDIQARPVAQESHRSPAIRAKLQQNSEIPSAHVRPSTSNLNSVLSNCMADGVKFLLINV